MSAYFSNGLERERESHLQRVGISESLQAGKGKRSGERGLEKEEHRAKTAQEDSKGACFRTEHCRM